MRAGDNDKLNKLDWLRSLGRDVKDVLATTFFFIEKNWKQRIKNESNIHKWAILLTIFADAD